MLDFIRGFGAQVASLVITTFCPPRSRFRSSFEAGHEPARTQKHVPGATLKGGFMEYAPPSL
jgi:hypothetical protein